MAYRKKTLRHMSPQSRRLARLIGEMSSITARLKSMLVNVQRLELDSASLATAKHISRTCSECGKELDDELERELKSA